MSTTDKPAVVGIDIGGTRVRFAHAPFDTPQDIVDCEKHSTRNAIFTPGAGIGNFITALDEYSRNVPSPIAGICVAVPGRKTQDGKGTDIIPNIKELSYQPLGTRIEQTLQVPAFICFDSEANLLSDAQYWGFTSSQDVLGLYFGTSIGTIMLKGGQAFRYRKDIGKITAEDFLPTLPDVESRNVGERLRGYVLEKHADDIGCHIANVFSSYSEYQPIRQYIEDMAYLIAQESKRFPTDKIMIGGGIPEMVGFPRDELIEIVSHFGGSSVAGKIAFSPSGRENGCIGACLFASGMLNGTLIPAE